MSHGHTLQKCMPRYDWICICLELDLTCSGCVQRAPKRNVPCNLHVLSWDDSKERTLAYVNVFTVD